MHSYSVLNRVIYINTLFETLEVSEIYLIWGRSPAKIHLLLVKYSSELTSHNGFFDFSHNFNNQKLVSYY